MFQSCINKNDIIEKNIDSVINNYIETYPIQPFPKDYKKWGLNYPSYSFYFQTFKKDTIVLITLLPMVNNSCVYVSKNDDSIFNKIDGCIFYDKSSPVVFYNSSLYDKINIKKKLKKQIPDSLLFNNSKDLSTYIVEPIFNYKEPRIYKIENRKFKIINKNDSLYREILKNYLFSNLYFE
jgi:hypothetical protein